MPKWTSMACLIAIALFLAPNCFAECTSGVTKTIVDGQSVTLTASPVDAGPAATKYSYQWTLPAGATNIVYGHPQTGMSTSSYDVTFNAPTGVDNFEASVMISNHERGTCQMSNCVSFIVNHPACPLTPDDDCVSDSAGTGYTAPTWTYSGPGAHDTTLTFKWSVEGTLIETDIGNTDPAIHPSFTPTWANLLNHPDVNNVKECNTVTFEIYSGLVKVFPLGATSCEIEVCLYWTPAASVAITNPP